MSKIHTFLMSPRWGELDAFGHVNNVNFLRYFEEARVAWLGEQGWGIAQPHDTAPVVANVSCSYKAPVYYPAELSILTEVVKVGNSSFALRQKLNDSVSGCCYAEANFDCVWVNMHTTRPVPVPEFIRLAA